MVSGCNVALSSSIPCMSLNCYNFILEMSYLLALTSILNLPQDKPTSTLSFLQTTTQEEVWKIICISPSKGCTHLDHQDKNELLPTIIDIINSSLRSSDVPTSMKSAVVTPLLKKATLDPEILKNYRPFSNLSFVSKVLERVVAQLHDR